MGSGKKSRLHTTGGPEKQCHGLSYFGPRQARILSKLLTHAHLPGLTSLGQVPPLALAATRDRGREAVREGKGCCGRVRSRRGGCAHE